MSKPFFYIGHPEYVQDLLKQASKCDTVHAPYSARVIIDRLCDLVKELSQAKDQP